MSETSPTEDDRKRPRLAYIRSRGWVIVEWSHWKRRGSEELAAGWLTRPGGVMVTDREVLAWADLPPVPEEAA